MFDRSSIFLLSNPNKSESSTFRNHFERDKRKCVCVCLCVTERESER